MESEKKRSAGEKIIQFSCLVANCEKAIVGITGSAKKRAWKRLSDANHALAEAVEKFQKEN